MEVSERYRRRPGLPWREEQEAARDALAALEAGRDAGGEGTLLVVERGRITELNLLGVCIPEQYGGAGFDYISLGLVCEELEAVDTSLRVVMSVHMGLNSLAVLQWGTEEQKQRFLAPRAHGRGASCTSCAGTRSRRMGAHPRSALPGTLGFPVPPPHTGRGAGGLGT